MNNLEDFKYIKGFGGKGGGSQAAQPTAAYEDLEGFVYRGQSYNVYQFAKVKDLLSEGPIEGLVEDTISKLGRTEFAPSLYIGVALILILNLL